MPPRQPITSHRFATGDLVRTRLPGILGGGHDNSGLAGMPLRQPSDDPTSACRPQARRQDAFNLRASHPHTTTSKFRANTPSYPPQRYLLLPVQSASPTTAPRAAQLSRVTQSTQGTRARHYSLKENLISPRSIYRPRLSAERRLGQRGKYRPDPNPISQARLTPLADREPVAFLDLPFRHPATTTSSTPHNPTRDTSPSTHHHGNTHQPA